jgi:hypothetical protein
MVCNFLSVCNSHVTTPSLLTYLASYGFPCNNELELITPRHTVLRGRDKEKLELSKIDYYLLLKSS